MKLTILGMLFGLMLVQPSAKANVPDCQFYFQTQDMCATFAWLNEPAHNAAGSFRLYFWNRAQGVGQQPIFMAPDAASVNVKLFMSSMHHGGGLVTVKPTTDATGAELDGQYDATQVRFVMAGPWEIIVDLKDANGAVKDTAQMSYRAQ